MILATLATLLLLGSLAVIPAEAGESDWISKGPSGGEVKDLAVDSTGSTLYAATDDGPYKSVDGGESWTLLDIDVASGVIVLDPKNPSVVYSASFNDGIFKTTDGGIKWKAINDGLSDLNISSLAVDPSDTDTLYAGTQAAGIFKSMDGGASWSPSNLGISNSWVFSIAIDTLNPSTLLIGTSSEGVLKSEDGGINWLPINNGLPSSQALALAINPVNPSILYAGLVAGLYSSSDGGASWVFSVGGFIRDIVVDPSNPSTVYAAVSSFQGVMKTTDGGTNWGQVNAGLSSLQLTSISFARNSPSTLYVGSSAGAFKTTSAGSLWFAANEGLSRIRAFDIAVDPDTPSTLYLGTNGGGVFKSSDRGESWSSSTIGLTNTVVGSVEVDPTSSSTLYAGTGAGVFRSRDSGATWEPISAGLPGGFATLVKADPNRPGTLYARSSLRGVFKTTSGGNRWSEMNEGLTNLRITDLVIDPNDSDIIYVSTAFGPGGVFKSTDGAASWVSVGIGLTNRDVLDLAIGPGASSPLYASSNEGLFQSVDGAANWSFLTAGAGRPITIDPDDPTTIYWARGRVLKSTDGGSTFTTVGSDLPLSPVEDIVIDANDRRTLLVALATGGIYETTQRGECSPSATTLCLGEGDRFAATISWESQNGNTGVGTAVEAGFRDGGLFWFFNQRNPEMLVKVLDGCSNNGHYWVFFAATTNVGFNLTVEDTGTGRTKSYSNPLLQAATPTQDTRAFACL